MFRLLNILFSDNFFFSTDNGEYDALISDDGVFEDVDASCVTSHSAAKLHRMWKEVSSNFARAEAGSKTSGQNSHNFWEFCNGRADVYYFDRRCEHRRSGREFCAANVYSDGEDDSTKESEGHNSKKENRKKRKGAQSDMVAALIETVNELLESEPSKTQEDMEQKHLLQEKRAAQKLVTLTAILERNVADIHELKQLREQYVQQGINVDELGKALAVRTERKLIREEQIDQLELDVLNRL
eukprot:jgi/Phyca11/131108/e_gw1.101.53.1